MQSNQKLAKNHRNTSSGQKHSAARPSQPKTLCRLMAALLLTLPVAFYGEAQAQTQTQTYTMTGGAGGNGGSAGNGGAEHEPGHGAVNGEGGNGGRHADGVDGSDGTNGDASETLAGGIGGTKGTGGTATQHGNSDGGGGGGGNGGNGGNSYTAGSGNVAEGIDMTAGDGGNGGKGGDGGASKDYSGIGAYGSDMDSGGGDGGNGGGGGGGGSLALTDTTKTVGNIKLVGGKGGNGGHAGAAGEDEPSALGPAGDAGNGGHGGAGGSANLTLDATQIGTIKITAGNGGDAGDGSAPSDGSGATFNGEPDGGDGGTGGNGGQGGDVSLTLQADAVRASNISLQSGKNGEASEAPVSLGTKVTYAGEDGKNGTAGNGGSVSLTAAQAQLNVDGTITLTKNDGDLTFTVGTLEIGDKTTSLVANNSSGERMTASIGTLLLTGSGNLDDSGNAADQVAYGKLKIDGGTLNDGNFASFIGRTYTSDTTDKTLTLGSDGMQVDIADTSTYEIDRIIQDESGSAGSVTLNSTNQATVKFSAKNIYTGKTAINGGTLVLTADGSIDASQAVSVAADATLRIDDNKKINNLEGAEDSTVDLGEFTLTVINEEKGSSSGDTIFSGDMIDGKSASGHLTKQGAGTFTVNGANHYTGDTEVKEGTYVLAKTGNLQSALLNVASANATVVFRGSTAGDVVNTAGGLLVFDSANSSIGGTLNTNAKTQFVLQQTDVAPGTGHDPDKVVMTMTRVGGSATLPDVPKIAFSTAHTTADGKTTTVLPPDPTAAFQVDDSQLNLYSWQTPADPDGFEGRIVLVDAAHDGIKTSYAWNGQKDQWMIRGVSVLKERTAFVDAQNGDAVIDYRNVVNPGTKGFVQGWLAGMALLNTGGDMVMGLGMDTARQTLAQARMEGHLGWRTFGAVQGGDVDHDTGSHINLKSWSLMVGVAAAPQVASGEATLAAFIEYGKGDYDTHNRFSDDGGDLHYWGLGILGRRSFANDFYVEGSLRAGRVKNGFEGHDLRLDHAPYTSADYDGESSYYSVHLGGGYVWKLGETRALDSYVKYFYTHQEGDSTTADTGDELKFDDVDSSRLRVGTRFVQNISPRSNFYIGAAYEHEFDAKTRATAYNRWKLDESDLKGDTWIGEAGLTFKPTKTTTIDLSVQGFTGQREGGAGSVEVNWAF